MIHKTGVIFDMDGVLVDTVNALYQIYLSILADYKIHGSIAEFNELNGPSIKEVSTILSARYLSLPTPEKLTKVFQLAHNSLYESIELIPDAIETLQELNLLGVQVALASSSNRHNINIILDRFDLANYFHFTISGDEVNHAKPHPEIYQLAGNSLNAEHIYAIDDSFNGVKSALNAGISAIQFTKDDPVINKNASYNIIKLTQITAIIQSDCQILGQYNKFDLVIVNLDLTPYFTLIDDYWRKYKDESMFDADVLLYLGVKGNEVQVIEQKYKTVFYILHNPTSALAKMLSPIGVSGFVLDMNDNILLAKRSSLVTQYKNAYECPPSGSIDCVNNYQNQILVELEEEVNIPKSEISKLITVALIKDKIANQFDIIFKIKLKSSFELIMQNNNEYDGFNFLPIKDLHSFTTNNDCLPETSLFAQFLRE